MGDENPAPPEVTLSQSEYETLLARIKEFESLKDQWLRSAADYDNAKKRLMREREAFVKFSQESLLRDLLPILDNFERALSHAEDLQDPAAKNVMAGIEMVFKRLGEVLKSQGLKRIPTVGKMFDPHQHEAVGHVEGSGKEDEVVEEVEPGYFLHDRLLRAAKVRVRTAPKKRTVQKSEEEKQEEIT